MWRTREHEITVVRHDRLRSRPRHGRPYDNHNTSEVEAIDEAVELAEHYALVNRSISPISPLKVATTCVGAKFRPAPDLEGFHGGTHYSTFCPGRSTVGTHMALDTGHKVSSRPVSPVVNATRL